MRLPRPQLGRRSILGFVAFAVAITTGACGGPDPNTPNRSADAEKWLARAKQSYRNGDAEDASEAIDGALKAAPRDEEARVLAARIALAKLDYAEAVRLTEGLETTDAKGIRGRALWYSGDIESAADELEDMLRDPAVKDPWARDVAKLARRGQGRHPFAIEGGVVAAVEMPQAGPALIVPCELDGERILALVATNFGELMIDSDEPQGARVGQPPLRRSNLEVKDVPALTHDLSATSRGSSARRSRRSSASTSSATCTSRSIAAARSSWCGKTSMPPRRPTRRRVPVFYMPAAAR
jgi:hypothetical protein